MDSITRAKQKFEYWVSTAEDHLIKAQLEKMRGDETAVINAFYKDLEFGTAGMRGEIGAGTNCLNIYTIAKVTQGLCDYMKAGGLSSAAITRDSRINSDLFAETAARVFAANGFKVYVTEDIMPTPFLSYMTRTCGADIGVMITASHNPAKYNGYKVYNRDGYQMTDKSAGEIAGYVEKTDEFGIVTESFAFYKGKGLIEYAGARLKDSYLDEVKQQSLGAIEELNIVFSPLNGAGYKLIPELLRKKGAKNLITVGQQSDPDGNFPTCPYPNPEKAEALALGINLLKRVEGDILIATDPDADRMGLAVRDCGEVKLLTGNETGVLLTDYLFSVKANLGTLPEKPLLIKTIVTSELAAKVAAKYGGITENVLTGFKYIGERITELELSGEDSRFVLGFEESYGYLAGSYVRDKDAVVASMLAAEMAAYHKKSGKTLWTRLAEIYEEFGTYEHKLMSFEFPGEAGSRKIKELMTGLRKNPPKALGGGKIICFTDYRDDKATGLPKSDVLRFENELGSIVIVRPSGTEPLVKFYLTAARTPEENRTELEKITLDITKTFAP